MSAGGVPAGVVLVEVVLVGGGVLGEGVVSTGGVLVGGGAVLVGDVTDEGDVSTGGVSVSMGGGGVCGDGVAVGEVWFGSGAVSGFGVVVGFVASELDCPEVVGCPELVVGSGGLVWASAPQDRTAAQMAAASFAFWEFIDTPPFEFSEAPSACVVVKTDWSQNRGCGASFCSAARGMPDCELRIAA